MSMTILITGAAGYIGSHATRVLCDAGQSVVALDNLSKGYKKAVDSRAEFLELGIEAGSALEKKLQSLNIESVLHFAGRIEVGESVQNPELYFQENLKNQVLFFESLKKLQISRVVFSSTAAVYGQPEKLPIEEDHACLPINPYGQTKLAIEWLLKSYSQAYNWASCALRYFNVAGAHPSGEIGEAHEPETHLIPNILKSTLNKSLEFKVFGTNYPTRDGSCVRDYIHVMDLVEAHRLALEHLEPGHFKVFNLGSEEGFSVLEIIAACEKVTGQKIAYKICDPRPGDPAQLIANNQRAQEILGWSPTLTTPENMISSAWRWHQNQRY